MGRVEGGYTAYQTNRAQLLDGVNKDYNIASRVLNHPDIKSTILPYRNIDGQLEHYQVTAQALFGIFLIRKSLYNDLVAEGQKETADDILNNQGGKRAR